MNNCLIFELSARFTKISESFETLFLYFLTEKLLVQSIQTIKKENGYKKFVDLFSRNC